MTNEDYNQVILKRIEDIADAVLVSQVKQEQILQTLEKHDKTLYRDETGLVNKVSDLTSSLRFAKWLAGVGGTGGVGAFLTQFFTSGGKP